jgi:GntR family transcriptional regulator
MQPRKSFRGSLLMTDRMALDTRPLYAQVREMLRERIRSGALKPGAPLPNEFALARELGVSQGTVRKALDALAAENLLVRSPGRGTFVREQTAADVLFRFFHLYDAKGARILPDSRDVKVSRAKASRTECERLALEKGASVVRISRLRTRDGEPFVTEHIAIPADLFPGLEAIAPLPNTLYDLFQRRYGVTVARAEEKIAAAAADPATASALGIADATPLLRVDRIAFALDDRPIEWRVSLCHLADGYYLARIG